MGGKIPTTLYFYLGAVYPQWVFHRYFTLTAPCLAYTLHVRTPLWVSDDDLDSSFDHQVQARE